MSNTHTHNHNQQKTSSIIWALVLNASFCIVEIIAGLLSNSMAILSDAVHDLGDTIALGSALFFEHFSLRSADDSYTFGYRRFSVLSAIINSIILLFGSFLITFFSVKRLFAPEVVSSEIMFWVAIGGIVINWFALQKLRPHSHSHNHSVLSLHLLEDVLGWVAVLIGSILIYFTQWYIIDPILSIAVSLYIGIHAFKSIQSALRIFLQAVPKNLNSHEIQQLLTQVPNILSIHSFRVWTLDDENHIVSFHAVVEPHLPPNEMILLKQALKKITSHHHISQTTIEFEFNNEDCKG